MIQKLGSTVSSFLRTILSSLVPLLLLFILIAGPFILHGIDIGANATLPEITNRGYEYGILSVGIPLNSESISIAWQTSDSTLQETDILALMTRNAPQAIPAMNVYLQFMN